jgi:hypothetical protein
MESESNVGDIFKPIPINDEGKPVKGYSIYIEGELPKFLLNEQVLAKYKIIRPDGSTLAIVPTTFRKDIREEFIRLGYKLVSVNKKIIIPVKFIEGIRVSISNANWKHKYAIIVNKGDVKQIIDDTTKILKILLDNNVTIGRENICASYCGIAIKDTNDIDKVIKYKR